MRSVPQDEFVFSYSVFAAAVAFFSYFSLTATRMIPTYPLVEYLAYFLIPIWLLKVVINFVKSLSRRHWYHVTSILCAPLAAIAVDSSLSANNVSPEWIRLQMFKDAYFSELDLVRVPNVPGFRSWYWGGAASHTGPERIYQQLVYDESDEIAQPANLRSAAWKMRTHWREQEAPYTMQALGDHFYCLNTIVR